MFDLKELYWAAGFLEGEGYFGISKSIKQNWAVPNVSVTQVQKEPLDRLSNIVGGNVILNKRNYRGKNNKYNDFWKLSLRGCQAAGCMMTMFSLMSPDRKHQIKKSIDEWKSRPPSAKYRTHCPHGHPYDESNTYLIPNGWRRCKTCLKIRHGKWWNKNKKKCNEQQRKRRYDLRKEKIL